MFWNKKLLTTDDRPSDEVIFAQRIAQAHAKGDKRTELVHRLMLVSMEAEKTRVAMESIVDNYSDGLSDLTQEACHLFATPLASDISTLERLVSDHFETIENLAGTANELMSKLIPLQLSIDELRALGPAKVLALLETDAP
jgi:hypothetical protein